MATIIVYGDAAKREQFMLPRTLGELQRKCKSLFGFFCELYVDLGKVGPGVNSWSNRHIRSESDFKFIVDGDVVIVVDPNGRRIALNALFDPLTTYARDYVAHPLKQRTPYAERDISCEALPDLAALTYRTTYNTHFTRKQGDKKEDKDPVCAPRQTSGTGLTTYQMDYVPQPIERPEGADEDCREMEKQYHDYTTTHQRAFRPDPYRCSDHAGDSSKYPDREAGAPWRPTEYIDEYTRKQIPDLPQVDDHDPIHGGNERAVPWDSTYRRDFPAHPGRVGNIFADPELEAATY